MKQSRLKAAACNLSYVPFVWYTHIESGPMLSVCLLCFAAMPAELKSSHVVKPRR